MTRTRSPPVLEQDEPGRPAVVDELAVEHQVDDASDAAFLVDLDLELLVRKDKAVPDRASFPRRISPQFSKQTERNDAPRAAGSFAFSSASQLVADTTVSPFGLSSRMYASPS